MRTKLTVILALVALFTGIQTARAGQENREVPAFSGILLRVPAKLHVAQGEKQSIEIVAKESTLEDIITEVKDRELVIRFPNKRYLFKRSNPGKIEIFITVPEVGSLAVSGSGNILNDGEINTRILDISVSGSGDVTLDALKAERVRVSISGSGDIKLSGPGKTSELTVSISGSGNFYGIDFPAENVDVKMSGSGNVDVYADNDLNIKSAGSGDVTYRGNPNINQTSLGSGTVKSKN